MWELRYIDAVWARRKERLTSLVFNLMLESRSGSTLATVETS